MKNTKSEQKPLPKPPQPEPVHEIFTFKESEERLNTR